MYRGRRRACPGCGSPMRAVAVGREATTIDRCDTCSAAFFDYFDGEPGRLSRALRKGKAGHAFHAKSPKCPDCDVALEDRKYLDEGPTLGRCPSCMGAFVSADRLGELRAFAMRAQPERSFLRTLFEQLSDLLD